MANLSAVPFHDTGRARRNFAQVLARVPRGWADILPPLLADLPDPDAALNFFERLTESAGSELIRLLDRHRSLVHQALAIFGNSQFLGETLLQNPDLFHLLLREGNLDRSHSHEEFRASFARFRSRCFETDIALLLARFKRREYVRIVLRDVLGLAALAETTAEISALSDVLIEEALRHCAAELHGRYGTAQHRDSEGRLVPTTFAVLALGKLGGNELNYSSDIDLLYLYGDGQNSDDVHITNREYFVRLGQQITGVLSRVTPEGFVFRIDLRLRPQGREGEAAISLMHASRYYREAAHDWERQALIKARHVAGDRKLSRLFLRGVEDRIYTAQLNFAAIETALDAVDRIREKRFAAHDGSLDVKLDRGGIRDIEFLVQCLQRVYGGAEPWLRSRGTLFALQKLHDKGHLAGSDFHHLTSAYEFLRTLEHRLQLRHGQQTHRIPPEDCELRVLARSLAQPCDPQRLLDLVRERMAAVTEIYGRVIHQHQQRAEPQSTITVVLNSEARFGQMASDQQVLLRLRADAPALYAIATREELDPHTRRNLFRFLSSAFTSAEHYAAVAAAPDAVERALELFRRSDYLSSILAQHPEDIVSLRELRTSSKRHQVPAENFIQSAYGGDLEQHLASTEVTWAEKMALLRRRFRYRTFLSAARDVVEPRPVSTSLTDTTTAAEEAIAGAWMIAGHPRQLAICALGRLGTSEFDFLSDADLLFVRDAKMDPSAAARIAEEIVQALSAYTNEGNVMPIDLRLRPHGGEGEIAVTLDKLESYFKNEALSWEALTYTKFRRITGDESIAKQASAVIQQSQARFAAMPSFAVEVREMRAKLGRSEANLKTAPGGFYDLDFLIGFLTIKHGVHAAEGTTADRLRSLARADLAASDLQMLLDAVELFRSTDHAIRLATGKATQNLPASDAARRSVEELTARMMTLDSGQSLEDRLASTQHRVREIFDRIVR